MIGKISVVPLLLFTVALAPMMKVEAGVSAAEARAYVSTNAAFALAVANGEVLREALVASKSEQKGVSREMAEDALNRLLKQDVVLIGSVTKVAKPVLSRAKYKVVVTVGAASGQPINVDCLVPTESESVASLQPGRAVAFRGVLSDKWRMAKGIVGDETMTLGNARLVSRADCEKMRACLQYAENLLPGDRVLLPRPFGEMEISERRRVCEMARCAASAYPATPLPEGYHALSREDWRAVAKDCGFGEELYLDDGFFILGNGLRGRFLVKTFPRRTVIVWSGCDCDSTIENGEADFLTAAKQLLTGDVRQQYAQAETLCRSILKIRGGDAWIVGHSLGGSLATYAALTLEDPENRLSYASFNGLGVSAALAGKMSGPAKNCAGQRMVNVYCVRDPIHVLVAAAHNPFSGATKLAPVQFGRSYYLTYAEKTEGEADERAAFRQAHDIDPLVAEMDAVTPPLVTETGWTWIWSVAGAVGLILIIGLVILIVRKRA